MIRETIYEKFFRLVAACAPFNKTSRRLEHWSDVSTADQPALFMSQRTEETLQVAGMPTVWILRVDLYIYAHTRADRTKSPSVVTNPLVDAICALLAPNAVTGKVQLGGLVEHAWIEGHIQTDEGALGDQGVIIIPIAMKVSN